MPTAASIGASVAQSLSPMLLDLKENMGPITVQIIIDGQIVKTAVVDSLNDPAVAHAIRDRGSRSRWDRI